MAQRLSDLLGLLDTLGRPDGPDERIRAAVREVFELASGLDPYLERHTSAESAPLRSLAHRTASHDWSRHGQRGGPLLEQEMLSGHVEGQLLAMLVHAIQAHRVLEIGMFTGYATLAMAEALPADGRVVACELDPDVAAFARDCFAQSPHAGKIDIRVGPAADTLSHLAAAGDQFDLVFLDADKAGYLDYLNAVLDADLLSPTGLICADNTLMQGLPWTEEPVTGNAAAIARFNDAVTANPLLTQVVLPLRDGLTLICRTDRTGH